VALESYRDEGYLAAAMRNYLMLLGWAPSGDREIVPWEVVEAEFRLADVNPSPAFFDERKLRAFNGEYIRALPVEEFAAACQPWLVPPRAPWPAQRFDPAVLVAVAPLAQTRVAVLGEVTALVDFLFLDAPPEDGASWAKVMTGSAGRVAADILRAAVEAYAEAPWQAEELKARLEQVGTERGLKLGKVQAPVRVAVTGRTVGLPLFESLVALGRERTLDRLRAALTRLAA
jgi:glutamyl-tRNA synthetase